MRKQELKIVNRLPELKLTEEPQWDFVLQKVQCPTVLTTLSPAQQTTVEVFSGKWLLFLHWVIRKKWDSKHKIPLSPKYAKFYEPKGEQLYRILEMCIQCCYSTSWRSHYVDAAHWFSAIIATERGMEINYVINESQKAKSKGDDGKTSDNRTYKNDIVCYHWGIIKTLQEAGQAGNEGIAINPYNPQEMPHHYRLIEAASGLARRSDIFRDKFWKPYLSAYRKWTLSLNDSYWQAAWLDRGKLKAKTGRGNGEKTIQ